NEVVLRTQAQAEYAAENYGHFGLALGRYAHFTSPIRRYADLIVHRALIRALKLGDGGLADHDPGALSEIAARISAVERRAMTGVTASVAPGLAAAPMDTRARGTAAGNDDERRFRPHPARARATAHARGAQPDPPEPALAGRRDPHPDRPLGTDGEGPAGAPP